MGTMADRPISGCFQPGLPFNRFGDGPRTAVVLCGLTFEIKPLGRLDDQLRLYRFLAKTHTVWVLDRQRGLAAGSTLTDMANDVAAVIREELGGGPVDLIGLSTGGSIALHLAADHHQLVDRLVLHSCAHSLSPECRELQRRVARLAAAGRWRAAYEATIRFVAPGNRVLGMLARPLAWWMARSAPDDPTDLILTIEAEDGLVFRDRLGEIRSPTLVVAGALDAGYSPELFRETASAIPDARLALYPDQGHPASGRRFERDVAAFLGR
jgi:pimeloyl-ACP methyl ester carboxylesterase